MLSVNSNITVPAREFDFTFSRSSGPGGQNVNKVNTKVTMHWDVTHTPSLPEAVRARFLAKYKRRINANGQLVIYSQRYRDQGRNVADCLDKLREMILSVATVPKARKATKPSKGSRERRLREKKSRSQTKQGRGRRSRDFLD
jgi:ribosome-associated protein